MALTGLKQSPWSTLDNHWDLPPHLVATEQGWLATLSRTKTQSPTAKASSKYQLNSPSLLVCLQAASSTSEVQTYAGQLSNLLEASLDHTYLPQSAMNRHVTLANEITSAYDLLITGEPRQSLLGRLFGGAAINATLERVPTSLLVARQPRWPLKHILLVVRSEEVHGLATAWTVRLAQASGAAVTVLALVPQFSPIPSREARQQQSLLMLLAYHPPLERQIAYVSQQLQAGNLEASLRLRPGALDQQVRAELSAQDYDLIVVATEAKDWWLRRLLGESVESVLKEAAGPVLIAKPSPPRRNREI